MFLGITVVGLRYVKSRKFLIGPLRKSWFCLVLSMCKKTSYYFFLLLKTREKAWFFFLHRLFGGNHDYFFAQNTLNLCYLFYGIHWIYTTFYRIDYIEYHIFYTLFVPTKQNVRKLILQLIGTELWYVKMLKIKSLVEVPAMLYIVNFRILFSSNNNIYFTVMNNWKSLILFICVRYFNQFLCFGFKILLSRNPAGCKAFFNFYLTASVIVGLKWYS